MRFIDPSKTPFVEPKSRGELPHLYKPDGTYFVTFRLFDAVVNNPRPPIDLDNTDITAEETADYYDPPITSGSCVLKMPELALIVQDSFLHFEAQRYNLFAWCVMPNHAHVVFKPTAPHDASDILQSWKGFTARKINRALAQTGTFWEHESFDHLIRSAKSLHRFIKYTNYNPCAAGLCKNPADWPFSSAGVNFQPKL